MEDNAAVPLSSDPNRARILVVGPMGGGKTSLVHALCNQQDLQDSRGAGLHRPRPTIGCNVNVKLLLGGQRDRSIEFWDIGGHPDASSARKMFFEDSSITGVIFVYDLSNSRSIRELRVWINDLKTAGIRPCDGRSGFSVGQTSVGTSSRVFKDSTTGSVEARKTEAMAELGDDLEDGARRKCVPTLVVGNKKDAATDPTFERSRTTLPAELMGCPHAFVCARTLDERPFLEFFDRVFLSRTAEETSDAGASEWTRGCTDGADSRASLSFSHTSQFSPPSQALPSSLILRNTDEGSGLISRRSTLRKGWRTKNDAVVAAQLSREKQS